MSTKMYVGNLPFDVTELQLREAFSSHGEVSDVNVVMDFDTGQSRGFAFVTMADKAGSRAAIRELDGKDFHGRALKVNEARPRESRPSYSDGGGNRRGYR